MSISQKELNSDLERYLSRRTKPTSKQPNKKPVKVVTDTKEFEKEEEEYYSQEKTFTQKLVNLILGDDDEDTEQEIDEKGNVNANSSIFSRVKSLFSSTESYDEKSIESEVYLDEDIKSTLKMLNKWISKLPAKHMKAFKASKDYEQYKDTLRKYQLIKE